MQNYLPFWIGLRYTRSSNKQRFLSLLSWVSLVGMILGVCALILVLSVMNGFQDELRGRLLSLLSHADIEAQAGHIPSDDYVKIQHLLSQYPEITSVAPKLEGEALLTANNRLRAVSLQGIDVSAADTHSETNESAIASQMLAGSWQQFRQEKYQMVLGAILARNLGLTIGDKVSVMLPNITITPFGAKPRIKQFTVAGVFEVGADIDASMAFIRLRDAQTLYAMRGQIPSLQLTLSDVMQAQQLSQQLQHDIDTQLGANKYQVVSWGQRKAQLFAAVKMEKVMVAFMLTLVIAVAAFNLISLLSMMVAEKRLEIAVLRMMGLSRIKVLLVFFTQGLSLALVSVLIGGGVGIFLALNLSNIVNFIEQHLGLQLFDPDVFYITGLPSRLDSDDVIFVAVFSVLLSVIFSLYPAYRASKIQAIEAMQS